MLSKKEEGETARRYKFSIDKDRYVAIEYYLYLWSSPDRGTARNCC